MDDRRKKFSKYPVKYQSVLARQEMEEEENSTAEELRTSPLDFAFDDESNMDVVDVNESPM